MVKALGIALCCAVCASPALAGDRAKAKRPVTPLAHDFDLADMPLSGAMAREDACPPDPVMPRLIDTRDFTPPALRLALSDERTGPVLALGALGAKHKDAPRLAHVAVFMDF